MQRNMNALIFPMVSVKSQSKSLLSLDKYKTLYNGVIISHVILLIIEGCPNRLIVRYTVKPYILLKNLFH